MPYWVEGIVLCCLIVPPILCPQVFRKKPPTISPMARLMAIAENRKILERQRQEWIERNAASPWKSHEGMKVWDKVYIKDRLLEIDEKLIALAHDEAAVNSELERED